MLPKSQKGFAHLFMLLLLLAGIGIGIYLVQHPTIFSPRADTNSKCIAYSPQSFRDCLLSAQLDNNVREIEITQQIVCSSHQECTSAPTAIPRIGFLLASRSAPLTIFGTPGTKAGFKRVQNYNYPLLTIGGVLPVQNVTVKDLIFDDTTAECDFVTLGVGQCNSPLVLGPKIENPVVDHITILNSKNHGMQINNAFNITIKNSIIYGSGGDGIWFSAAYGESCPDEIDFYNYETCPDVNDNEKTTIATIENNLIADSEISGLEFYGHGYPQNRNMIKGNLLVHNHKNAKYIQCPNPSPNPQPWPEPAEGPDFRRGGHCGGGQLSVARSNYVTLEENIIRDGKIDTLKPMDRYNPEPGVSGKTYEELSDPRHSSGIELSELLNDIQIRNNKIYNNSGVGLFADYVAVGLRPNGTPRYYYVEGVGVFWNMVYGNHPNFAGSAGPGTGPADTAGFGDNNTTMGGISFANNQFDPSYAQQFPFKKAFIFADPPICNLSADGSQCESKIRWYSQDYPGLSVTIKGNTETDYTTAATIADGVLAPNWITKNGATFQLRDANKVILKEITVKHPSNLDDGFGNGQDPSLPPAASVPVVWPDKKATGQITGTSCTIPSGQTKCTSKITWSTNDAKGSVKVVIKETGGLFAQAPSGSQDFPWVSTAPLTMQLMDGDNPVPLASVVVKATLVPSLITADPNPCKLSGGKCTSQIKLNATGYANLQIKIREANNATFTAVGANPTGTYTAPWISATPLTFDLYSNGSVIGSVAVKGTP